MTWNNRIFRHKHPPLDNGFEVGDTFAIHETFYNDAGEPDGWTEEAISGHYESVDELIQSHALILADAIKYQDKVLNYEGQEAARTTDESGVAGADYPPSEEGLPREPTGDC